MQNITPTYKIYFLLYAHCSLFTYQLNRTNSKIFEVKRILHGSRVSRESCESDLRSVPYNRRWRKIVREKRELT